MNKMDKMTDAERLKAIQNIILHVENRCMACDGPVTNTREEMTDRELQEIYLLTGGKIYGDLD